ALFRFHQSFYHVIAIIWSKKINIFIINKYFLLYPV
ncbi:uncharacterized protein METZ01_LOCUS201725, partial [marine metagenome]